MKSSQSQKSRSVFQRILRELRWLTPGLGVKRWVALVMLGTGLIAIGVNILIMDTYSQSPDTWWLSLLSMASLYFLPNYLRIIIFVGIGFCLIIFGTWGANRAILKPFVQPGSPVVEAVSAYRRRGRGPRVVTIGGGTGLASLLRGLKFQTLNLTAIVTVADDGGSSGELRRTVGILPPGDIRNCLTALSNDETMLSQIFQYRFAAGAGLNGHTLGNLFITALAEITGSFEEAVAESGRVLAVQGKVLPSTLHDVRLAADVQLPDGKETIVKGESNIPQSGGRIRHVWLEPNNPLAFPPAIQSILNADLIIVGPGSLYTSILPNLLVPDIAEAIKASRALKFFVCNVATQKGETEGYSCGDHVRTIEEHLGGRIFDLLICNQKFEGYLPEGIDWVRPEDDLEEQYVVYKAHLVEEKNAWRHDSKQIAQVIMDLFFERTGPLLFKEDEF